jgi:hypothetical protein
LKKSERSWLYDARAAKVNADLREFRLSFMRPAIRAQVSRAQQPRAAVAAQNRQVVSITRNSARTSSVLG